MKRLFAFVAALALSLSALAWPFFPVDTTNVAVTATAQSLTLSSSSVAGLSTLTTTAGKGQLDPLAAANALGLRQIVLTNVGTQTVFVRTDGTTATVSNGMPIPSGSQVLVTLATSTTTISAIATATGSTLYATVGNGQ